MPRMWWKRDRRDLDTRVKDLETDVKRLKLEWDDVLDKVFHRLNRLAKRERDALGVSPPTPPAEAGAAPASLSREQQLSLGRQRLLALRMNGLR